MFLFDMIPPSCRLHSNESCKIICLISVINALFCHYANSSDRCDILFNSENQYRVYIISRKGDIPLYVGRTPSGQGIEIPRCHIWFVEPIRISDMKKVMTDMQLYKIPGLKIPWCRDSDLNYLISLSTLKYLDIIGDDEFNFIEIIGRNIEYAGITDRGMEYIGDIKSIVELHVRSRRITSSGFTCLRKLEGMNVLDLEHTFIMNHDLIHLMKMNDLEELNLSGTLITDKGMNYIRDMKNIRRLDISYTGITDDGVVLIGEIKKMEKLDLSHTKVTNRCLEHMRKMPDLKELLLCCTGISDDSLMHLKDSKLQYIDMEFCNISDKGLEMIEAIGTIQRLGLCCTRITDIGMKSISKLKNLKILDVTGTGVSDRGIEEIAGNDSLEELYLAGTGVTDLCFKYISDMIKLKKITVGSAKISKSKVDEFRKTNPNIQVIDGN